MRKSATIGLDWFTPSASCCPVPIVIAGGKKLPEIDALTMAWKAIDQGAAGVDMGRNIFQSDDPVAMIQAVGAVVHKKEKPEKAFQLYQQLLKANRITPKDFEEAQKEELMVKKARQKIKDGVTVSDDDVISRRTAATNLATRWGKEKTVSILVSKAAEIAEALGGDGRPSPELGSEVQTAIQKKSASFLYEERPLEISVCAGMAMVSILAAPPGNTGWTNTDVYAIALWSALAYQPVLEDGRREDLRQEVLGAAENRVGKAAEAARQRTVVPDPDTLQVTIDESNETTNNFKEAVTATVEALRRNAALDREELDFLWWAQLGRSRLLNRQLSAINEPTRIIAAAIEGAKMLRRLPCEVHRELVLRTLDQNPEFDLAELVYGLLDRRDLVLREHAEALEHAAPGEQVPELRDLLFRRDQLAGFERGANLCCRLLQVVLGRPREAQPLARPAPPLARQGDDEVAAKVARRQRAR